MCWNNIFLKKQLSDQMQSEGDITKVLISDIKGELRLGLIYEATKLGFLSCEKRKKDFDRYSHMRPPLGVFMHSTVRTGPRSCM